MQYIDTITFNAVLFGDLTVVLLANVNQRYACDSHVILTINIVEFTSMLQ